VSDVRAATLLARSAPLVKSGKASLLPRISLTWSPVCLWVAAAATAISVAAIPAASQSEPVDSGSVRARAGKRFDGRAGDLEVPIPRLDSVVQIDGRLDEGAWTLAAALTGFSSYRPVDGRAADDSTEVLVWYGPDAIYFGIRAREAHGSVVRATLADRDNIDTDDRIEILLDTYHDHRRALLFAVNPLGVQQDGVWSDGFEQGAGGNNAGGRFDATIDLNPDYVYESRGHVTPDGYEVEIRIPFKSIRYQSGDPQTWGIQVLREVQHSGYEDTWTPAVRANASFLIQSGTLTGLTNLHRGLVMDVTPEFTQKVDGQPNDVGYGYKGEANVGGTVRVGLTPNLTAAGTANPDFSQVEADVGQVSSNQRFALFYPEKRPFFLEGLEQYDTPNTLIYTRRIVQPVAGAKLTGKIGSMSVAYLGAADQTDSVTTNHPISNLLRLRQDFGASSTLGLVFTDLENGGDFNRVLGTDARFVWRKLWFSQLQLVGSATSESDGRRDGALWDVVFGDRTGRKYGNHVELRGVTPDFVAASGFVNRTDYVTAAVYNRFTWYGAPGAVLEQLQTFVALNPLWRYHDFFDLNGMFEGGANNQWNATLRGGWGLSANVTVNMQQFDPANYTGYSVVQGSDTVPFAPQHALYNLWNGQLGFNTPNRALSANATVGYGAAPIFAEAAEGRQITAQAEVNWRPTRSLHLDLLWTHQTIDRASDGSNFLRANIPRLKVEYQLTRAVFIRYVGQYFAQDQSALRDPRSGAPIVLDSAAAVNAAPSAIHDFRSDVLFAFHPTPGTVLLLGYGATLSEPNAFQFQDLTRQTDGFFFKISYLFRL